MFTLTRLLRGRVLRAFLVSSFLALLFTGCATSNRTALAPSASRLAQVHVTATVSQPEIAADVNPSNIAAVTGGGLIAALIDTAVEANRAKKAENVITPLRDSLVNFDCAESLRGALETKLTTATVIPVKSVKLANAMNEKTALQFVKTHEADAVLLVSADYRLTPDFDRIRVLAKVQLLGKKEAGSPDAKPLYENDFATYRALSGVSTANKVETVKAWSENDGARAREAIAACFAELAEMIEFDLQQGVEANMPAKEKLTTQAPPAGRMAMIKGLVLRGEVVRQQLGWAWVRLPTGELSATH